MKRVSFAAKLTLLGVALSGCQRGCLLAWWESHTSGAAAQQNPTIPPEEKPGCVAGLVRCSGGSLQASRAQPDAHCTPEGCLCPWDDIAKCARGCVMEGVPLELSVDAGAAQLCAPDLDTSVVSHEEPAQSGDAGAVACEMEGFFCRDGRVSSCSKPKVAVCTHGCADLDDLQIDDDGDDLHAAALILCARR